MKLPDKKHIHFIGICGVAMSALAIMANRLGWKVTGSDKGFYPPISTHLKNQGIEYYPGWHPENIGGSPTPSSLWDTPAPAGGDKPDLVVVGNVAGSTNQEFLFVKENKIPYVSYPEFIEKYLIKKNSIVCAGTYGKTSTTALLSYILKNADYKPAYMFGGLSDSLEVSADNLGGDWSIVEGDEYKTSRWENTAKFFHYSPTHLLLTAIKWDHADVYATLDSYFEAFKKLVDKMPKGSLVIMSEEAARSKVKSQKSKVIVYGKSENCNYQYFDVKTDKNGLKFKIKYQSSIFNLQSSLLGEFQAENITGAFAMAHQIGIAPELITELITEFKGIKRRLEIRGKTKSGATVIDDIAHSPDKVESVLKTLKNTFTGKIFCVFEPNSGNRKPEAKKSYKNKFNLATQVVIPRLTKIKNDDEFLNGQDLSDIINKDNPNTKYINNDEKLVKYLKENTKKNDVIVFCGSHSFRNMINETIN